MPSANFLDRLRAERATYADLIVAIDRVIELYPTHIAPLLPEPPPTFTANLREGTVAAAIKADAPKRGRSKRFTDENYAAWAKMRADGMTITAIAVEVGASHPTVANGIKSIGQSPAAAAVRIPIRTTPWPAKAKPDAKGKKAKAAATPADGGDNAPTLAELVNYLRLNGHNTSLWGAEGPPFLNGQTTTHAALIKLANEHRAAADLPPYVAA